MWRQTTREPGAHVGRDGDAFTVKRSVRNLAEFGSHDLIDADHRGTLFGAIDKRCRVYRRV